MLGLSGKLDLLIESPLGLFPVDFKASERDVHPNHITQLCGYALLLEEKFGRKGERGFVFLIPREEIVPVDLTEERKTACRSMLREIREAIRDEALPGPTELRAHCENCEYANYCSDIF